MFVIICDVFCSLRSGEIGLFFLDTDTFSLFLASTLLLFLVPAVSFGVKDLRDGGSDGFSSLLAAPGYLDMKGLVEASLESSEVLWIAKVG